MPESGSIPPAAEQNRVAGGPPQGGPPVFFGQWSFVSLARMRARYSWFLARAAGLPRWRWGILAAVFITQIPNGTLQYTWTLYARPLARAGPWPLADVQVAFVIFIMLGSLLLPLTGWLADRAGPRLLALAGGLLLGLSWVGASGVRSLVMLDVFYGVLGGLGGAMVYAAAIATALKWFPDHCGLGAGVAVAGYQAGPVFLAAPIATAIRHAGFRTAFLEFGVLLGAVAMAAALFLGAPPARCLRARRRTSVIGEGSADAPAARVVRTPQFWVMYVMFVCAAAGGLMTAAQLAPVGVAYHMDRRVILGGPTPLILALQLSPLLSVISWPLWGWISDRIGRELAIGLACTLEGLALLGFPRSAGHPFGFVAASGAVFFFWTPWALFPALVADYYGERHATRNYGMLYTAKGTAAIWAGSGAAGLYVIQRDWHAVFYASAGANFLAAALAWCVLRRLPLPYTRHETRGSCQGEPAL